MSGVGKGIASSSIAAILKGHGLTVTALKIDPYINVDAGTMNPTEHGEVFVLDDGLETDQDMGNYERFLDVTLPSINYMTTGSVYQEVIRRERNLEYKGKNVEVVPDIPLEVIRRITKAAETADADVSIIEIGGTVGEYQNILFLEAARMMKTKNPRDVGVVMVSYLPIPSNLGEMKTKPTQYAVRTLNSAGLQADMIIARAARPLDMKRKEKLATFCNVEREQVISAPDVESIYDVPLNFERDKLGTTLCERLGLPCKEADMDLWRSLRRKAQNADDELKIAIVGKYFDSGEFTLSDVYISVIEAIKFSAYQYGAQPVIEYVSSKKFEEQGARLAKLDQYDGIIVPGGFGASGIEGKLKTIKYAREKKIPYFGLCYGMQLAVIEYARNVAGLKQANTTEIDAKTPNPVVGVMEEQKEKLARGDYGGTMRLGAYPAELTSGTISHRAYSVVTNQKPATKDPLQISERHRHRYEINPAYVKQLEDAGLIFSGRSPDGRLMEIMELPQKEHPFFLGTQFHPEFLARPFRPHPLFSAFVKAAAQRAKQ